MKLIGQLISISLLLLFSGDSVYAQASGQTTIVAERPWARATPVADQVQFHSATEENGVSRMREMRTVDVTPGAKVAFSPGGLHIMVVGLKQPLKEGQTFPLTLTFEKAGKIEVTVPIEKVGAMQGGSMGSMTHGADEQKIGR